jgi:hypothetical protein
MIVNKDMLSMKLERKVKSSKATSDIQTLKFYPIQISYYILSGLLVPLLLSDRR